MDVNADNNYVIGRGRVFFDRFLDNSKTPTGERYFGNTPDYTEAVTVNSLDHYSSEHGTKEKDDSIDLSVDNTITLTCDNIDDDNLALWFLGVKDIVTISAATAQTSSFASVSLDSYLQVGTSTATPAGVGFIDNVTIENNNGAHASATATFSAVAVANDTITIGSTVITWKASGAVGNQINIGTDGPTSATNLGVFIDTNSAALGVNATVATSVVSITANTGGTAGNAIVLARTGTAVTLTGSGHLAGGSAGVTVATDSYDVDLSSGRVYIHADASDILDGDSLTVTYDVGQQTVSMVLTKGKAIFGALRFIAENSKGSNRSRYIPYCKISPNGNYDLKGDAWQTMSFSIEALKRDPLTEKIIKY